MRGLAEFVLKGRMQAIIAVVLIGVFPPIYFVSPVIVGLIVLRKGMREATFILAWAFLPIAAWTLYPSMAGGVPGNLLPIFLLFSVTFLAYLLRTSNSWQFTVLAATAIGLLFELYLSLQPQVVTELLNQLAPILEQSGSDQTISHAELRAMIASIHGLMAVLLLIWSRWMQAMLFNPGGFRTEFHSLRIEKRVAAPLMLLTALAVWGVVVPDSWIFYFIMPMVFAGIGLVHATIAMKQLSPLWLFLFYAVFPVVMQFLVLLALIDSWYDFRKQMQGTV